MVSKDENQNYVIIGIAVALLLIALGISFKIIQNSNKKIIKLNQLIEREGKRNFLLSEMQQMQKEFIRYKQKLPSTTDTNWFINEITTFAKSAGVNLISVQPEKIISAGDIREIPIRIVIECGYHPLGSFVEAIENTSIFLRVEELVLQKVATQQTEKDEGQATVGKCHAEMVLYTFTIK